ncbi:MAG: PAS domain S-box protein [Noviherbaspirillum sp.]
MTYLYTRVKQGVANMAASEAAEDALRKSEQRFKSLFEHPGDSIIIMDSALRIHDANQRACLEFSDTREELLKLPASEVEAQCGPNAAFWYALRAGQTQLGQGLKRRKNGSTVLAEVHISRFEEATRNFPGRRPRHRWAE